MAPLAEAFAAGVEVRAVWRRHSTLDEFLNQVDDEWAGRAAGPAAVVRRDALGQQTEQGDVERRALETLAVAPSTTLRLAGIAATAASTAALPPTVAIRSMHTKRYLPEFRRKVLDLLKAGRSASGC